MNIRFKIIQLLKRYLNSWRLFEQCGNRSIRLMGSVCRMLVNSTFWHVYFKSSEAQYNIVQHYTMSNKKSKPDSFCHIVYELARGESDKM